MALELQVHFCTNFNTISYVHLYKKALELQVHFCTNFNTNSYANLYNKGSGAPGPFLYQFRYKFICKSIQKWLWSSRSISVSISIQFHKQICSKMDVEVMKTIENYFSTKKAIKPIENQCFQ